MLQVTANQTWNTLARNVHLCKLVSTKICQPLQRNFVPTATVMFNPTLMGLTFFFFFFFSPQLISSFLSDLSLSQPAEGLGGSACCASCLELHLLLCLLGLMAINFHKVQNTMIHAKNSESTHNPAASALFLTPSLLYIISHTLNPFSGKGSTQVRVMSHLIAVNTLCLFTLLFHQLLI